MGKIKQLTEYEKGYIEAFIDTDGWISLYKTKYLKNRRGWVPGVGVGFCNNSKELLTKVQQILGINKKLNLKKGGKNYQLRLSPNECRELLPQLNLVIKEEKRKIMIELLELTKKRINQNSNSIKRENKLNEIFLKYSFL